MGENLLPNIPAPGAEAIMADCRTGLTRTNSVSSSLNVDSSRDFSLNNADATPCQNTEWTDERHNLYLDSLEASFVKQLHSSMGLHGWQSQGNRRVTNSSHELPGNAHNFSDQFTVLRNGCWKKISFHKNEPLLDCTVGSHVSMENSWISRFRSSSKRHISTSSDSLEHINEGIQSSGNSSSSHKLARSSVKHRVGHSCHQDLVGSMTEVSDQNFVDEDQGEGSSCTSRAKRLKTDAVDSSSNDQIVPSRKFHSTDIPTDASSKREGVHRDLLSEDPEKFVSPESDVHFFLRES